jgi:phosphoglycolate phosphatase-like HAD superfamily hydrolase
VENRIPGAAVEVVETPPVGRIRHALFDFDGTISNVRDGWQDFMVPMMVEVLGACGSGESEGEILACVKRFVDHLTGKQTIYQMLRLAEEIRKRGGTPLDPAEYKRRYHDRLEPLVRERMEKLRSGKIDRRDLLVPGSVEFLEELRRRGVALYLASGTDIEFVREEAAALGVDGFFQGAIFGALPNYQDFSKEKVIKSILADFHLGGPELLVVGDGYVEIENARAVGAVALGIYTEEKNRYHMNLQKRERLLEAGSHLLAPDLREGPAILDYLKI